MMHAPACAPALQSLCLQAVAAAVGAGEVVVGLPADGALLRAVTAQLPLALPLGVAATLVADEGYWERRTAARWKNCQAGPHGCSWKQLFLERNLQEAIERFDPATDDVLQLRRLAAFSRRFVQHLRMQQLPAQLPVQLLFDALRLNLTSLKLGGAPPRAPVGMSFDSSAAGMTLASCRMLARALAHTETLVVLDLRHNGLDDDRARMLASGLADNISVTQLYLGHNRISDRGARAAKLLDAGSVISVLDLAANQLQPDSGRALARALCHSRALTSLSVGLNRLGDEGVRAICDALARPAPRGTAAAEAPRLGPPAASAPPGSSSSSTPASGGAVLQHLDVSSNGAGFAVLPSVCSMLRANTSLTELDVSCNAFGERLSTDLVAAVASNRSLSAVELRGCGVGAAAERAVCDMLLERALHGQAARLGRWPDGG